MPKEIRLEDSSVISLADAYSLLGAGRFAYFPFRGSVILAPLTAGSVDSLEGLNFRVEAGRLEAQNPADGCWVSCERIADEYNLRNGVYKDNLREWMSLADCSWEIIHRNGNLMDNSPSNIMRRGMPGDAGCGSIPLDYYRGVAHIPAVDKLRRCVAGLYAFICMKRDLQRYIDRGYYETHCREYTSCPATWGYLASVAGDEASVNRLADAIIRDNRKYCREHSNITSGSSDSPKTKVFIASDVSCDEGRCVTAFMEAFLDERGYEVYSPCRDGLQASPSWSASYSLDARERACRKDRDALLGSDLVIALIDSPCVGCFRGDTRIRLAGGDFARICDMPVCEQGYKIKTFVQETGEFKNAVTLGAVQTPSMVNLFEVEFNTSEKVYCSGDHPFLTEDGVLVDAKNLKNGTVIKSICLGDKLTVQNVMDLGIREHLYGLEVIGDSHLYVLSAGGAVVGNSSSFVGMKIGAWNAMREAVQSKHLAGGGGSLSEGELALLGQDRPRVITFSDTGKPCPEQFTGSVLRHCDSWGSLADYLDYADKAGIQYVKKDGNLKQERRLWY